MVNRKKVALALLALSLVFALGFGATASGLLFSPSGGVLNLLGPRVITLDPALSTDAGSAGYIVEIFSGLVTLDRGLSVVPDIAQDWDVSADGTTYTFYLRKGVRFHDGKEVKASDFKYSMERACDPETGSEVADVFLGDIIGAKEKLRGEASQVSGVRAVNDATLEIKVNAPKPCFLAKLTYPVAFVVDKTNVESGENWTDQPNGTGPFKLREWQKGERIILERNPYFYKGTARLDQINFALSGRSLTMYENGDIDIAWIGLADIERVLDPANPLNEELVIALEFSISYVGFNTAMPPLDDMKVRQALSYAVDKDKIIQVVLKGMVKPAQGILPPGMPGYDENLQGLAFDLPRAKALIAESKYHDVSHFPPIIVSAPGMGAYLDPVLEAIIWMWQDSLGVKVEIQQVEWVTYLEDLEEGRFQLFGGMGWIADYPDPEALLDLLFHSQSRLNRTGYSNPEVDHLLEEARVEGNVDARLGMYQQAEQIIINEASLIPVSFGRSYVLVKPYVKGYFVPPIVIPILKNVWLEGR